MPRPSQRLDEALLRSGRALYAEFGCAGLSQRRLAEHAGTSPGMFHYHFASKQQFLHTLLQQLYDEMFAGLQAAARADAPAIAQLRAVLIALATFARSQRALIVRLATDAAAGEVVVREMLRANAPRHLGLLARLLQQARADGALAADASLQQFAFVMGAVVAPIVIAPAFAALGLETPGRPRPSPESTKGRSRVASPPRGADDARRRPGGSLKRAVADEVLSDAAIAQRVDLALGALQRLTPAAPPEPAR
jgi:AcrR family transcriptional regulator